MESGYNFKYEIESSPKDADIAFAPIDSNGNLGPLNTIVLKAFGYNINFLSIDKEHLFENGFTRLYEEGKKTIIFIVTKSKERSSKENLEINLKKALQNYYDELSGKYLWIPLMGLSGGDLNYEESYYITLNTIRQIIYPLNHQTTYIFSFPKEAAYLIGKVEADLYKDRDKGNANIYLDNTISRFLDSGQNCYLAGAFWDEDQSERFFEEGIWENGHEDKFIELVNSVNKDDIIFLKSTFAKGSIGYLRIKGIGIVTENPQTGILLTVDWIYKNIEIDIPDLSNFRSTFSRIPKDVIRIIFDAVIQHEINIDVLFRNISDGLKENISKIAALISDTDEGEDYLDISKDVNAFAKIMASKTFSPPLAIALLAKWGTGKSFFMKKLNSQITRYSERSDDLYCKGIVQIHFNAWSYLDANLWASLVSQIFEHLNTFINENARKEFKDVVEKELAEKLFILKEEQEILSKQKNDNEIRLQLLEEKKETLNETLTVQIGSIRDKTLSDLIKECDAQFKFEDKLSKAIQENQSITYSIDQIKNVIPEKYWDDPNKAYTLIKSKEIFIKTFLSRKNVLRNFIIVCLILLLIICAPIFINNVSTILKNINVVVPQFFLSILTIAVPIYEGIRRTYFKLQPIVAAFWEIKETYEKTIKTVTEKFEQEEKALALEIDQKRNEIKAVHEQIVNTKQHVEDLEFKMKNMLSTEALKKFIYKRCNSEDYNQFLGLISYVRKDFDVLSKLFHEHNKEAKDEFQDKFKIPLQRIILYIDDLDRCSEERVVEVLEAVNLLMAFPLFIVVVGVDINWVKNSLIHRKNSQFIANANLKVQSFDPINYLEKIFQVPFHLKEASDRDVKNMIKNLVVVDEETEEEETEEEETEEETEEGPIQIGIVGGENPIIDGNLPIEPEVDLQTHLRLSKREVELLQELSGIIGTNPRAVKRFVNVYQIVRAHEGLIYEGREQEDTFLRIMFLLALPMGKFKMLLNDFRFYMRTGILSSKNLDDFLEEVIINADEINQMKYELKIQISENSNLKNILTMQMFQFNFHNEFIQRFTFDDIV